jgi:hypothetical protein
MRLKNLLKTFLFVFTLSLLSVTSKGQVLLEQSSGTYSQNFNTLATSGTTNTWTDNSTLLGWYWQNTGTGKTYNTDAGTSTAGGRYSYGSTSNSDRAMGSIGSSNVAAGQFAWGVQFKNSTGSSVEVMKISYVGEQWRNSAAATQTATFWYKKSSSLINELTPNNSTGWIAFTALNFTSPITGGTAGALDGNASANRVVFNQIEMAGIDLGIDEYIMFRWDDPDHSGSDHGLSIDDFSFEWSTSTSQVGSLSLSYGTGTYYTPFVANVTITTTTEGAAIYYTLNGDEPTESSTLYQDPIAISTTTTLKARGFKAGLDPSAIGTAVYTFNDPDFTFSSIAELRNWNPEINHVYRLNSEAVVAYARVARGQKYIQDATASILIDDNEGNITTPIVTGDGITGVTGKLSRFNGMLQFVPVQDVGLPTSTGNEIVIVEKTLATLTESDQAKLIRVPQLSFNATGNFTIATDFNISDPSGAAKFRTTFSESDYIGDPIPSETLKHLIAFVNYDNTAGFRLVARNWADFVYIGTDATLATLKLGGVETINMLNVEVSNPETDPGATLFVPNFIGFEGIVATPTDEFASRVVTLNGVEVEEANLATQTFANNDVVVVSVTAEDGETMKYYKVRVSDNASDEAEIISFTVSGIAAPAEINSAEGTVSVNVLFGTNVTSLVPTIVISNGATIDPASGVAQDFTSPVVYTVTAENTTTTKEWTVTVTVLPASNQAEILTFSFAAQSAPATINTESATVNISVVYGTNVTSLSPTITVSPFAGIVPASGVSQNFSAPVQYTVTAQDGTEKVWTVTVTISDPVIVPIYNIQYTTAIPADSPYKEQSIFTQGIVTAWHYAWEGSPAAQVYKGYFLQDGAGEWNGIRVYNTSTTTRPNVGDRVRIKGTVKEQFYNTEINSVTNETVILSTGNELPAVSVVTTLDANSEKWEGVLVKVVNANCTSASAGFGMATVNDGSGQIQIDDDIYKHTFTQGTAYNITGVVYYSYDEQKILPRSAADVSIYTSSPTTDWKSGISAYPNPFTSSILVDNAASVRKYSISNIIGQQLVSGTVDGMSQIEIGTENLPQGIYLITFENALGEKAVRKMIKK